jgi:hypothetical protein
MSITTETTHVSVLLHLQGQQAAVKLSATYDAMLTLTQIICYCWEGKLRQWSSHRIVMRHMAVATLLVMLVLVSAYRRIWQIILAVQLHCDKAKKAAT